MREQSEKSTATRTRDGGNIERLLSVGFVGLWLPTLAGVALALGHHGALAVPGADPGGFRLKVVFDPRNPVPGTAPAAAPDRLRDSDGCSSHGDLLSVVGERERQRDREHERRDMSVQCQRR